MDATLDLFRNYINNVHSSLRLAAHVCVFPSFSCSCVKSAFPMTVRGGPERPPFEFLVLTIVLPIAGFWVRHASHGKSQFSQARGPSEAHPDQAHRGCPQARRQDLDRSRVGGWRASFRVRWIFRRFRSGLQSGSHGRVSSPPLIKPDVRISRIRLSDEIMPSRSESPLSSASGSRGRSPSAASLPGSALDPRTSPCAFDRATGAAAGPRAD